VSSPPPFPAVPPAAPSGPTSAQPVAAAPALRPRRWARDRDWFDANRAWGDRPPADLHGAVEPGTVEAASGHTFRISLTCGPGLTLTPGAHVTVELPETWDAHLANCYRRGVRTVGARDQLAAGYGAFLDVACTDPDVRLAAGAWWGRLFDLVDVVVTGGAVHPGEAIVLTLGTPDGNLVACQKYAQVAVLTTGVDLAGDGVYARAATHPSVRVVGAAAGRIRVFTPGTVRAGSPFPVRLLPVDLYSFNPAPDYAGHLRTFAGPGLDLPPGVAVTTPPAPQPVRPVAVEATAGAPGVYRITVLDPATGVAGQSGPIGAGFLPAGPGGEETGVYFGELHSQMWHSMGSGTTAEFFTWGRDAAGLDFCAPANHYNHRAEATDEVWQEVVDTANAFDQPGRFATLVSYEWGGVAGSGHKNVYYRGARGEFGYWYRGDFASPEDLWRSLAGRDVLTVPHHTKFGSPTDWRFRNDTHQRLVEICSLWGISEAGGPHSVQTALAMGHRLGFVGGTDSHYGLANQGSYHLNDGNGLACVVAPRLTRDAIWQALHDRHCYATTGDRILLDVRLHLPDAAAPGPGAGAGHPMGTDLPVDLGAAGRRRFVLRVAGTHRLDAVELLRNNRVVFTAHPEGEDWQGEWTDGAPLAPLALAPTFAGDRPFVFYYLRVRQRNRQVAWSSPVWLTQAPRSTGGA
jgi:hypothetical protein